MTQDPGLETPLRWQGEETIAAVLRRLDEPGRVVIELPQDYNHAIYALLHDREPSGDAEEIDAEGDADLLRRIAGVQGLENLAQLAQALADRGVSVRLQSPPTITLERRD